jgi:hypothetical protein
MSWDNWLVNDPSLATNQQLAREPLFSPNRVVGSREAPPATAARISMIVGFSDKHLRERTFFWGPAINLRLPECSNFLKKRPKDQIEICWYLRDSRFLRLNGNNWTNYYFTIKGMSRCDSHQLQPWFSRLAYYCYPKTILPTPVTPTTKSRRMLGQVSDRRYHIVWLEWDAEGKKPKPDRSYIQGKLPDSLRLLCR